MIKDVQQVQSYDEGRRVVAISELADRLKSDFEKQYVTEYERV